MTSRYHDINTLPQNFLPSRVETAMTAPETLGDTISDEARDATFAILPLGRVAQPIEITHWPPT